MIRKLLYIACIIFIIYLEVTAFSGCIKEYSYEGGPVLDTIPIHDSTTRPRISFPVCAGCSGMDDFILSVWNFKYGTSFLCGNITNAVITTERNAFTFFGPSACSTDTGLVMTVYLDSDSLDGDKSNITTNHVIFEYYDNTMLSDIFISSGEAISLTIDTYEHTTGIAKGRFSGNANTKDSVVAAIMDGKFAIKFK